MRVSMRPNPGSGLARLSPSAIQHRRRRQKLEVAARPRATRRQSTWRARWRWPCAAICSRVQSAPKSAHVRFELLAERLAASTSTPKADIARSRVRAVGPNMLLRQHTYQRRRDLVAACNVRLTLTVGVQRVSRCPLPFAMSPRRFARRLSAKAPTTLNRVFVPPRRSDLKTPADGRGTPYPI